jgi:uncharacterized protein (TIGR00369 family)
LLNKERIDFLRKDFVQGFPAYCGVEVENIDYGVFQSKLNVRSEHKQQDGFVHAGVIATMADHTAGYSAYTVVPENMRILTIEFKINYFKPALGTTIICNSKLVNKGKTILVAESELFTISEENENLISKAIITLTAVPLTKT